MGAQGLSSRAIIGEFFARLEQNEGMGYVNRIGTVPFQSDQAQEEYKWLGQAPGMREWIGGRQAKGLRENGFIVKNKKYESTLEVLVDELRRDKTAQLMVRIAEQADRANAHWAKLMAAAIIAGESTVCYDGQYFFDTDHSEGDSGAQSNDLTYDAATTTAPTAVEMEAAILKSVEALFGFKDDQGEPINETAMDFVVMVPVPFMSAAAAALKNPIITDSNGMRTGTIATALGGFNFQLVTNPRLQWTTKFATFRADGNVKPFIRQEEVPLEVSAIAEGSETEFKEDKHLYGIKAIRGLDYGYWQHAALTTFV
ncbi:Mu-like prophage major head subunit gpT family protein [Desulfuromonas sp. KJ2020]|uniref:Mu-like prophage major head subunit gpT family protein n=1 Tax=Desulfuromonas sp. KJ2020 TaxID=2919173 RepID=UPI0020A7D435|nr:Mu-like prophage major head subunit gpT family protein [Desulfuromonas sp. KJ2020]MCP3177299.1 Mu-like prophage major head subunit gpT family protein [Desulfuromonas sp. KJ2020]